MKLLTLILPRSKGSKMMTEIKKLGGSHVTCMYGMGIEEDKVLSILKMNKKRKEIVRALIENKDVEKIFDKLDSYIKKDNQSIAFTVELDYKGDVEMEYQAIYVIVDRHDGDEVIEIAQANGAKGATVMHGRGAGIPKESTLMNMTIEPEKDIILMIVSYNKAEKIKDAIYKGMNLKGASRGIIFSLPVLNVRGLVEQN
ncbi:MAG: P-II family nitrogen regulator [Anaerococcus sp.]